MIRSLTRTLAVAGLLAAVSTGALAQEITKEHLAAARAAIEASKVAEGFDNILLGVTLQTKTMFQRGNPSLSAQIDEVTNKVALDLASRRPDLDKEVQMIWAKKFTKPELDEIAKFYNSPVGKKLASETQNMVQQSMASVMDWQQKLSADMVTKVREEMAKRGNKL